MKKIESICLLILMCFVILGYASFRGEDNNVEISNTDDLLESESVNTENTYTQSDLDLLARVVNAEAGYDYCTDEWQRLVASIVINRVNDNRFPDTIKDVIFQNKFGIQYACAWNGALDKEPSEKAIKNAEYILQNGSICPNEVIFQSESKLGKVYKKVGNTWFCYG